MKHIDKTPFRSESGEINIINRVRGMLKYGMTWYDRVKAQDAVAEILGRQLGGQFVLLQNIVLPGAEIDLPLVLIGPPGVYLINALHERGVYLARDDEWGTLTGETFVPARINQVKRAMTMAKVLQVYLDRMGYKGFLVEPVVMSPDPKLHIDSTRPAVRVVMSDAIDRFAPLAAAIASHLRCEYRDGFGASPAHGQEPSGGDGRRAGAGRRSVRFGRWGVPAGRGRWQPGVFLPGRIRNAGCAGGSSRLEAG